RQLRYLGAVELGEGNRLQVVFGHVSGSFANAGRRSGFRKYGVNRSRNAISLSATGRHTRKPQFRSAYPRGWMLGERHLRRVGMCPPSDLRAPQRLGTVGKCPPYKNLTTMSGTAGCPPEEFAPGQPRQYALP